MTNPGRQAANRQWAWLVWGKVDLEELRDGKFTLLSVYPTRQQARENSKSWKRYQRMKITKVEVPK